MKVFWFANGDKPPQQVSVSITATFSDHSTNSFSIPIPCEDDDDVLMVLGNLLVEVEEFKSGYSLAGEVDLLDSGSDSSDGESEDGF